MQESIVTIGMLAGGLGLFLLAVNMITDGLKLAAGNELRDMLRKWTSTPIRGIVSGISITAIVQSSSAVTVATIGFVNAGLITLYQSLGVVYGANIGTTMTGWLVAVVGFNVKIEMLALPLIGIGMFLRITGGDTRRAPIGIALAGFGLFFIGIDVLKDAFAGLTTAIDLQRITVEGISGILLFVGIGFLMTLLTQSSSAAIAITLTAASGGVVGPYAAAGMVIGANVGTTSTAVLSVIGATPNAKRVAAAHVIFNVATGVVALLLLPLMFGMAKSTGELFGLIGIPVVTLALFHTTFNILGVLLMLPFTDRLTRILEQKFTSLEEVEGRPKYLDKNVAVSPALALSALAMELSHLGSIARRMSEAVISQEERVGNKIKSDRRAISKLVLAIGSFVSHLERSTMPKDIAGELPKVLRTSQYYLMTSELAMEIAVHQESIGEITNEVLLKRLSQFKAMVVQLLDGTDVQTEGFSVTDCNARVQELDASYDELKAFILEIGTASEIDIGDMSAILEQNSNIRRLVKQMVKAARYLSGLFDLAGIVKEPETAPIAVNQ
ncbi:MAG: sodium:phosphate symporter [Gammaproteobacteria bacterium SG8_15]|nr:MAG: sodium:phosphate symporter [Gammaproteobacteria bacterium SG8_15]